MKKLGKKNSAVKMTLEACGYNCNCFGKCPKGYQQSSYQSFADSFSN